MVSASPPIEAAPPPVAPPARRTRHWSGLDGLRAIAVAAVVAFHMDPSALPGGFLGVDVFFVISGFLITSLLLTEWRRRHRILLVAFWLRRVRRLYPAVVTVVLVFVVACALFVPSALVAMRTTIPATLVYLTNWWFIFHHVPYFQAVERQPVFLHFWSLAIEEQYYLVWPPILALALLRRVRPVVLAGFVGAAAVASAVGMALLYHPGASTARIYYGSDTHAQGLLIGSMLGLLVVPDRFTAHVTARARWLLDGVGAGCLALVVVAMVVLGQADGLTWLGGIGAVSALTGLVVVVAVHPASRLGRGLAIRPLRWLGTRSYSVYLWHWPILDLLRAHRDVSFGGPPLVAMQLGLILVASEGSYRFVEQPWRTGAAQRWLRRFIAGRPDRRRMCAAAGVSAVAVVAGLTLTATAPVPPGALGLLATGAADHPVGPATATSTTTATTDPGAFPVYPPPPSSSATSPPSTTPTTVAPPLPAGLHAAGPGGPVLAVGDSVMLAASPDLQAAFGPSITVDAEVGRQVVDGLARLSDYRHAGRLRGVRAVVVGLGTNGPFEPAQMITLTQLLAGVPRVVLVNVRVPDPWQSESNDTIASAAHRAGWSVVDWYHASAAPGVLYPDLIHPDPAGQIVYANLIVKAVTGH